MNLDEIFNHCAEGYTTYWHETMKHAELARGSMTYSRGVLLAQDYRTAIIADAASSLPVPLSKVHIEQKGTALIDIHNSVLDEFRSRLMRVPKVYRAFAPLYKQQLHTEVLSLTANQVCALIRAMYVQ